MCTVLLPTGLNQTAFNKYIKDIIVFSFAFHLLYSRKRTSGSLYPIGHSLAPEPIWTLERKKEKKNLFLPLANRLLGRPACSLYHYKVQAN